MDDVAILATPFELQEVQIPMCVVYFFYIYVWTYCNTWLSVGGAGIAFKATIAKKPDYYVAKKKYCNVVSYQKWSQNSTSKVLTWYSKNFAKSST